MPDGAFSVAAAFKGMHVQQSGVNAMKNHSMKKYLIATSMLAAVGFAGSSHAADGVFEIRLNCTGLGGFGEAAATGEGIAVAAAENRVIHKL